jgi:hypothetical protein
MPNAMTEEEVLHAEDARYAAQMNVDCAAMERIFGDELVYFHSSGVVDTKASWIELLRSGGTRFRSMTRHECQVRIYGEIAIITGRGTFDVTARGQDVRLEQLFHAVWHRRASGLQLVSWQATRLLPKT